MYVFVDNATLSKTKRNLNRDFSDCSMMAEVIKHYLPSGHKGLIQVHNYIASNKLEQKRSNWKLLNHKVLCKLGRAAFALTDDQIEGIILSKYGYVDRVLL